MTVSKLSTKGFERVFPSTSKDTLMPRTQASDFVPRFLTAADIKKEAPKKRTASHGSGLTPKEKRRDGEPQVTPDVAMLLSPPAVAYTRYAD